MEDVRGGHRKLKFCKGVQAFEHKLSKFLAHCPLLQAEVLAQKETLVVSIASLLSAGATAPCVWEQCVQKALELLPVLDNPLALNNRVQ